MNNPPPVSVIITTHNRTNCAIVCIESFIKNIVYSGKLHWIIADDRSDESHKQRIRTLFKEHGIDHEEVFTQGDRVGQGASLNNGLTAAFQHSDFVLRAEDDWFLKENLPLDKMIEVMLNDPSVCAVRLAVLPPKIKRRSYEQDTWFDVLSGSEKMFNLQVMLCRKSIYDVLGPYREDLPGSQMENFHSLRFRSIITNTSLRFKFKVLTPSRLTSGTLDDPSLFFIHVGISVSGHKYGCPERFMHVYNNKFHIVTACKNSLKTLDRCAKSMSSQTYQNFHWVIVDDSSDDGSYEWLLSFASERTNVEVRKNDGVGMGAAWNTGLKGCDECSYVLFLDSDDYFMNENVLRLINDKLKEYNNDLDCLLLSYKNELRCRSVIFNATNLEEAILRHSSAPWSKCVRSSLYLYPECKFPVGKRCCNDTIQDLYLMSKISKVSSISTPVVFYSKSSPNSIWNNLTKDNKIPSSKPDAILAVKETIEQLANISFENEMLDGVRKNRMISLTRYVDSDVEIAQAKPIEKDIEKTSSLVIKEPHISTKNSKKTTFSDDGKVKHDAMFILGDGSIYQDKELAIAVHSMRKFCPFIDRIFIVGSKPRCRLKGIGCTYVPCTDLPGRNKDASIMYKVFHGIRAIPDLTDNFLLCSDDQLVTKPCEWNDFKPKYIKRFNKDDSAFLDMRKFDWGKRLYNTLSKVDKTGKTAYFYEPHIWSPVNKDTFKEMVGSMAGFMNAGVVFSQYYNSIDNLDHEMIHDHRFFYEELPDWTDIFQNPPRFIAYNDKAFMSESFRRHLVMLLK